MAGDKLEFRGPIGGFFTWKAADGGPLFLVGGGSGVVPLMAIIRHRAAGSDVPTRLLYSSRSYEEIIYREELESLTQRDGSLEVSHTLTRSRPEGWSGWRIDAEMLQGRWVGPGGEPSPSFAAPRRLWRGGGRAGETETRPRAREDRTLRTDRRLVNYGRGAQAGRQRRSWHPRGDSSLGWLARASCEGCGRVAHIGEAMAYTTRDRHHRPLPSLRRQCPHPARSQPRATLDRSEGHKVPAGRGRGRVKRYQTEEEPDVVLGCAGDIPPWRPWRPPTGCARTRLSSR